MPDRDGPASPQVEKLVDPSVIRLLLKIAETGRFAAAAASLGVTQPSVSQQVRRIEGLVGRPLFRRTRRGVSLTEDGEAVVLYARAMLGLAADLRRRLERNETGVEVAVGMSEDFCRTALPAVLRLFVLGHPHVRIRILSGTYDTLSAAIEKQAVDFAIVRRTDRFPEHELLYRDELAWIGGHGITLPVVDPVPLVMPLAPNPSRDTAIECLRAANRHYVIRFESVGIAGMEMALGADLGIAAGPRRLRLFGAAPLPDGHGLPDLPPVEFVLVRASPALSDVARAFADVLGQAAQSRFELDAATLPAAGPPAVTRR